VNLSSRFDHEVRVRSDDLKPVAMQRELDAR